jgi:hypothetical protein
MKGVTMDDPTDLDVETIPSKIKNHLRKNKGTYIMGGVALGIFALMQNQRVHFEQFLEDKGIDKLEFYLSPEDYQSVIKSD